MHGCGPARQWRSQGARQPTCCVERSVSAEWRGFWRHSVKRFALAGVTAMVAASFLAVTGGQSPAPVAVRSGTGAVASQPAQPKTRKTEQMRGFSLQMWVTPPATESEA